MKKQFSFVKLVIYVVLSQPQMCRNISIFLAEISTTKFVELREKKTFSNSRVRVSESNETNLYGNKEFFLSFFFDNHLEPMSLNIILLCTELWVLKIKYRWL